MGSGGLFVVGRSEWNDRDGRREHERQRGRRKQHSRHERRYR
jgi:hypothetical protein